MENLDYLWDVWDSELPEINAYANLPSTSQEMLEDSCELQGKEKFANFKQPVKSVPGPHQVTKPESPLPKQRTVTMIKKRKHTVAFELDSEADEDEKFESIGIEDSCKQSDDFDYGAGGASSDADHRQNHSEIEKRRRDKMNNYITELATLVPMCNAMNRKLDKLTVLRMAVQHMKTLRGSVDSCTEVSHKPAFLSDDELKHLILAAADGFLFVVGCDRGRILFVSESVKSILSYTQSELLGQSLFDILHPKDISKVKEQLSSSDLSPRERLIDAKNRKSYSVIHCTGYLKSWLPAKMGLEEDVEGENEGCNLSCLVAVGQLQPPFTPQNVQDGGRIKIRPTEFTSRHTMDGKFTYVDQRATTILGYLPQELLGSSVYEYYHHEDLAHLAETHRKVLKSREKVESATYRFKARDGSFIHLKTKAFSFQNPWTKDVEYIVATNTVLPVQEVTSSGQVLEAEVSAVSGIDDDSVDCRSEDFDVSSTSIRQTLTMPSLAGTRPWAGKIGRQIAEEVMEMQKETMYNVESTRNTSPTPATKTTLASATPTDSSEMSATARTCATGAEPVCTLTTANGLTVNLASSAEGINTESSHLLSNLMDQDGLMDNSNNSDGNDEAAMAVIMSLLEADAGLGGPVDFSDLPWPL